MVLHSDSSTHLHGVVLSQLGLGATLQEYSVQCRYSAFVTKVAKRPEGTRQRGSRTAVSDDLCIGGKWG